MIQAHSAAARISVCDARCPVLVPLSSVTVTSIRRMLPTCPSTIPAGATPKETGGSRHAAWYRNWVRWRSSRAISQVRTRREICLAVSERTHTGANPSREASAVNELLRELHALMKGREPQQVIHLV
jgi:hypothetical protein